MLGDGGGDGSDADMTLEGPAVHAYTAHNVTPLQLKP
jgi:hypothetical protein